MVYRSLLQNLLITSKLTLVALVALAGCQHVKQLTSRGEGSSQTVARHVAVSSNSMMNVSRRTAKATRTKTPEAAFAAARSLERSRDLDKARAAYASILKQHPKFAAAHHRLAIVYERLGKERLAQQHFESALDLEPDNAELLCDYGYSGYLRGDLELAEVSFQEALALQPNLDRAHLNLGLIQARTGRDREALASFQAAGCSNSESRANLAYGLMKEEKWPQAAQHLQVALTQEPQSRMLQRRLQEVRAVLIATREPASKVRPAAVVAHEFNSEATDTLTRSSPSLPASYKLED